MSALQKPGFQHPKGFIQEGFDLNCIIAEGTTVPANATAGYAPGCLFFKRLGTSHATVYTNDGTALSCTFVPLGTGGLDLSGLLATAAELNRNNQTSARGVALAIATAITLAAHEGRQLNLTGSGSSLVQTLPAATGTGGMFHFNVAVVNTSNHVITAAGSDVFKGSINSVVNNSATSKAFVATTQQNITFNGTTTGGAAINMGDVTLLDYAAGVWLVSGQTVASGTLATPFS